LPGVLEVQGCGWALHAPGGYGGFLGRPVRDMAQFRDVLRHLEEMGPFFLKILLTGPVDFASGQVEQGPVFGRADLRSMVAMARQAGLGVMVHANGEEGVRMALEADVDSLEHGYLIREETLRLMSQTSVTWVPTLVPVHRLLERCARQPQSHQVLVQNIMRIYRLQEENVALAHELGVRIAAGSDAGAPGVEAGDSLYEEIRLLSEAGVGAMAALEAATLNGIQTKLVEALGEFVRLLPASQLGRA